MTVLSAAIPATESTVGFCCGCCVTGDCSIWSLTRTDAFGGKARRLTIEVNRYGSVVQKRGLANRLPRPEEEHVVNLWAGKFNLDNRKGW